MTAIVAAAVILIAAACVAGLVLLAWLLHRDRYLIWRPGGPLPDVPADALIRTWTCSPLGRAGTQEGSVVDRG